MRRLLSWLLVGLAFIGIVGPMRYPIYQQIIDTTEVDFDMLQGLLVRSFMLSPLIVVAAIFIWAFMGVIDD